MQCTYNNNQSQQQNFFVIASSIKSLTYNDNNDNSLNI